MVATTVVAAAVHKLRLRKSSTRELRLLLYSAVGEAAAGTELTEYNCISLLAARNSAAVCVCERSTDKRVR